MHPLSFFTQSGSFLTSVFTLLGNISLARIEILDRQPIVQLELGQVP
jgi:hypothetical protein